MKLERKIIVYELEVEYVDLKKKSFETSTIYTNHPTVKKVGDNPISEIKSTKRIVNTVTFSFGVGGLKVDNIDTKTDTTFNKDDIVEEENENE